MKGASPQGGFTIVETLIVLATTGMLVIGAILVVSGQQNKVQFQQSVQDLQSKLQAVMNEVGTGFYPNNNQFRCTEVANNVQLSNANQEQGTNTDCIFLGKAVQFGSAAVGGGNEGLVVHSIAGLSDYSAVSGTPSLSDADPTTIARGLTTNTATNFPNVSVDEPLLYGLDVVDMYYFEGPTRRTVGAVAFVNGLGRYDDSQLLSGSQQVDVIPVNGSGPINPSNFTTERLRVVDAINNSLVTSPRNPTSGVNVCLASSGTRQSALFTIGSSSRGPSVTMSIKSSLDCS